MDPMWRGPPMFRNLPLRLPPDFVGPPPMRFSPSGRPLVRPPMIPFGDLGKPFFPPGPGRRLPPLPNGAFLRDFGVPPAPFPRPGANEIVDTLPNLPLLGEFGGLEENVEGGPPNPPGGATEDVPGTEIYVGWG